MKKWQLSLTIIGLLAVLVGMNYVVDWQRQQGEALKKQIEKDRQAAEQKAMASKGVAHDAGEKKEQFTLPPSTGPLKAPVLVQVFINNAKSCQGIDPTLKQIPQVYGSLVRMEWLSMADPKISERSDKLKIGCEAGLAVNGKVDAEIQRGGGKTVLSFRGPAGDKFRVKDVYAVINAELQKKGKQPPKGALTVAAEQKL